MSGGERQRVAIACAFLKNAPILLLEEAMNALDAQTEQQVRSAIDALLKERTSIVIAHRLPTILCADKVILIEQGKVSEEGQPERLLSEKGIFYRFCLTQKFALPSPHETASLA